MTNNDCRKRLLAMTRTALEWNLVTGTNGNFSVKDAETGIIYITPTRLDYRTMTLEDIVLIHPDKRVEGTRAPSNEWRLHRTIYEQIPSVLAIAHTHSPYATAFAALNMSIPAVLTETVMAFGGRIHVAQFALPGTEELGVAAVEHLTEQNVCLLAHHGVVAVGSDAFEVLETAMNAEIAAQSTHLALQIAPPKTLPKEAQEWLRNKYRENRSK